MVGRRPASERAQQRGAGEVWIDHAALVNEDIEWLHDVQHLTLWDVRLPPGLLARLPHLHLLDVRGGSSVDLTLVEGCGTLRGLSVNQVRGLSDVSQVAGLESLEYLSLYGLSRVAAVPSFARMSRLRRLDVGRMTGLTELGGLLDAVGLEELLLIGKVAVIDGDVARIRSLPNMNAFDWFADGQVPNGKWMPVVEAVGLPKAKPCFMRDWLQLGSA